MSRQYLSIVTVSLLAALIQTGCNAVNEPIQWNPLHLVGATVAADEASKFYQAEIDEFRKKTTVCLAENDSTMADFKTALEIEGKSGNSFYMKQIQDLELKNQALRKKLAAYPGDNPEGWKIYKEEFNYELTLLAESYNVLGVSPKSN